MKREVEIELRIVGESIDDVEQALAQIVGDHDNIYVGSKKIEREGQGYALSVDMIAA